MINTRRSIHGIRYIKINIVNLQKILKTDKIKQTFTGVEWI